MSTQNSNQFWIKLILGGLFGIGVYGLVKCERQEKWNAKGAVGAFLSGAVTFPLVEPGIRKIAENVKNLPPP